MQGKPKLSIKQYQKMKNLFFTILFFVTSIHVLFAQNARFSQIGTATMQFNPALTGRFDGKIKAVNLYSWQKSNEDNMSHQYFSLETKLGAYRNSGDDERLRFRPDTGKTQEKSPEKETKDKIYEIKPTAGGYWGLGLSYYRYGHQKSPYRANFFAATLARHFYNRSNKMFGVGAQAVYAQASFDKPAGKSPEFYGSYDPEVSGGGFAYLADNNFFKNYSTLSSFNYTKSYLDFNVGAYYAMVTDAVMFELGGAMAHLFYPQNEITDSDAETKLRHRVSAHSLIRVKYNNKRGLVQKNMYWQEGLFLRSSTLNPSKPLDTLISSFWAGAELYKINPKEDAINVNYGFYMRNFRTFMPYFNIDFFNKGNVRISYEHPINPPKFKAYTVKRTEIALILSIDRNTSPGTRFFKKVNFW